MCYREKVAWLSLLAMLVAFGPYFAVVAMSPPDDALPNLRQLWLFAIAVAVQVGILAAGHAMFRLRTPEDAREPADERDLAIQRRSIALAYGTLIAGVIMVAIIMPFYAGGWAIVNGAIFAIVLAELVSYGVTVVAYRRQS